MKTSFLTGRSFFVSQQHNFLQKNKNSLFTQNIFHVKRESSFIIYTTVIFYFKYSHLYEDTKALSATGPSC